MCDSERVSPGPGSYSANCQGTKGRTGPGLQSLHSGSPATHRDPLPVVKELEQEGRDNVGRIEVRGDHIKERYCTVK